MLSKIDLIPIAARAALVSDSQADLACSSVTGEGIAELVARLFEIVPELETREPVPEEPELAEYLEYRPAAPLRPTYRILRDRGELRIAGGEIERRAETLDSEDEGSVARLVVELEKLGIDEALREAGAKPGDDILIGTHRLAYKPRRSE